MNKRLDNVLVHICNWNPRERKRDTNRNCAPRKWEFAECAQSMKQGLVKLYRAQSNVCQECVSIIFLTVAGE